MDVTVAIDSPGGRVLTIGSVYIVFHYTNMLERPINRIVRQLQDLQQ